jgi:hypothetical protein
LSGCRAAAAAAAEELAKEAETLNIGQATDVNHVGVAR